MKVRTSFQSLALVLVLGILPSQLVHAQDSTAVSEKNWVSVGAGYASPGLAGIFEGWLSNGPAVYGLVVENTTRGGYDNSYSTYAFSMLGGVRPSIGPVHAIVAVGASFGDHGTYDAAALRPMWQVSADLPFTEHVALHLSQSALLGAPTTHAVATIGLSMGIVR